MTCRALRASIACWDLRLFMAVMTQTGTSFLNLIAQPAERNWSWWGRVIFYHSDVDALYQRAAGYKPDTAPRDAEWGERFFHVTDPDGHELSFVWPSHRQHICPTQNASRRPALFLTNGRRAP
jgi:hypothetical protein